MKKIGNTLSTVVYIVLGILLAVAFNQGLGFVLATDMPIVAVESNSMVPTFYKGDLLILQGAQSQNLKIGDIIVFSPQGSSTPIVHRVVAINSDGTFQTKGDANIGQLPFERSISAGQIHGREIAIVPYVGWVKIGLTEFVIPNILWIVIAAIAIYGASYAYKRSRLTTSKAGFKIKSIVQYEIL